MFEELDYAQDMFAAAIAGDLRTFKRLRTKYKRKQLPRKSISSTHLGSTGVSRIDVLQQFDTGIDNACKELKRQIGLYELGMCQAQDVNQIMDSMHQLIDQVIKNLEPGEYLIDRKEGEQV